MCSLLSRRREAAHLADGNIPKAVPETVEILKKEIDRLFELQREALQRATFLGMTAEEAKQIEERRKVITALVDRLVKAKSKD